MLSLILMVMFAVMVIIIDGEQILVFKMAIEVEIDVDYVSPWEGWVLKEVLYGAQALPSYIRNHDRLSYPFKYSQPLITRTF